MNQAIGMIESKGFASAINLSDVMVKSANIELLSIEQTKGFGWMMVTIQGDVGAVKAAIDAAKSAAIAVDAYVSSLVIPRPGDNILHIFSKIEEDGPKKEEEIVVPVEEKATKQEPLTEPSSETKQEEVAVIKEDKKEQTEPVTEVVTDEEKTTAPPKKRNKTGIKKNKKN